VNGFLLDTNIPSEEIKPLPDPRVGLWLYAQREDRLFLSAVTVGELRKGIALLPAGRRRREFEEWFEGDLMQSFLNRILPVTKAVGYRWGTITAERQLSGTPLGATDGLIAATALEHNLTLVTRNTKDFLNLGLTLVDPWESHP
jgi:predicted nucleic acid-binding protein